MELVEQDNHCKETYLDLLERFYTLFHSIFMYYEDILHIMEEIFDGVFI